MKKIRVVIAALLLSGCPGYTDNVAAVQGFELRYLGKWDEIARLNHSFE